MSFTKTLVPRYPTGINMIAECDIFYPLQNQITDWYPTKKPAPPPPPPPEEEYEDMAQGVLPGNFGTMQPQNEQQPAPIDSQVNARPPPPMDIPLNDVPENDAPVNDGGNKCALNCCAFIVLIRIIRMFCRRTTSTIAR